MTIRQLANATTDSQSYNVDTPAVSSALKVGRDTVQPDLFHSIVRFTAINGDLASPVTAADLVLSVTGHNLTGADQVTIRVRGVFTGNFASLPADVTAFNALSLTSSFTDIVVDLANVGSLLVIDVESIVNEIFTHISWGLGNAIGLRLETRVSGTTDAAILTFEDTTSATPYLDYTVPGSGTSGSLSATLSQLTLSAVGQLKNTGSASGTFSNLTSTITATQKIPANLAVTLQDVTLSAVGQLRHTASVNSTLQGVTLSSTGALTNRGQTTVTLQDATLSAVGSLTIPGAVSQTLEPLTATIVGGSAQFGSVSQTLGALQTGIIGELHHTASMSATLGALTVESAGGQAAFGVLLATVAGPLADMTCEAEGVLCNKISVTQTLQELTAGIYAGGAPFGALTAQVSGILAPLTATITTTQANTGNVTVRMATLTGHIAQQDLTPKSLYSGNWRNFSGQGCVVLKREGSALVMKGPCNSKLSPAPIEFVPQDPDPVHVLKDVGTATFAIEIDRAHFEDVEFRIRAVQVASDVGGVRPAVDVDDFEETTQDLTITTGGTSIDFDVEIIDNALTTDSCVFLVEITHVITRNVCVPKSLGLLFRFHVVIDPP